jgi:hypothetical protein
VQDLAHPLQRAAGLGRDAGIRRGLVFGERSRETLYGLAGVGPNEMISLVDAGIVSVQGTDITTSF